MGPFSKTWSMGKFWMLVKRVGTFPPPCFVLHYALQLYVRGSIIKGDMPRCKSSQELFHDPLALWCQKITMFYCEAVQHGVSRGGHCCGQRHHCTSRRGNLLIVKRLMGGTILLLGRLWIPWQSRNRYVSDFSMPSISWVLICAHNYGPCSSFNLIYLYLVTHNRMGNFN